MGLLRYLANKYGYTYKDPVAAQLSDSLTDGFYDIFNYPANIAMFAKGEDKPKLKEEYFGKKLPAFLKIVEPYAAKGQFLVGPTMTCCDFWIGCLYANNFNNPNSPLKADFDKVLAGFPAFKAYGDRFCAANATYISGRGAYPV